MPDPVLAVTGLDAYYGSAHILQRVEFEMGDESVAVVGRNGMGKTTLCATIMGMMPSLGGSARGSIRFLGQEILGRRVLQDRRLGDRLCPPGAAPVPVALRRRAPAHDRRPEPGQRLDAEPIYELFPRLAERRRNGGAQLSGGEQQMLAIGRALLDEPEAADHGRAVRGTGAGDHREPDRGLPGRLEQEGLRILLIEQNLGVATSLAERQLVMVGGRDRDRDDGRQARRRSRDAAPIPRRRAARPALDHAGSAHRHGDARALCGSAPHQLRGLVERPGRVHLRLDA